VDDGRSGVVTLGALDAVRSFDELKSEMEHGNDL
jgi:hypothetical protein